MTNYDQLRAKYLSKPENRKLYEIAMTKLEFIETIERLTKATSATQSSFPTIGVLANQRTLILNIGLQNDTFNVELQCKITLQKS